MNKSETAARDGYSVGDELVLCYAARRPGLYHAIPEEVEQKIFEELNTPERPDAAFFPSLSVGDVLSISSPEAGDISLAVEHIGCRRLPTAHFATPAEYNRYRQATNKPPKSA